MTEVPIAVWQVAGETWEEMSHEAFSDAQSFMQGYAHTMWEVNVVNCQPRRKFDENGTEVGKHIEDGRILSWEGHAVLTWR